MVLQKRKPKLNRKGNFISLPKGVEVGKLVTYFDKGWRTGTLEKVKGKEAGVKPIGNYLHTKKNLVWVGIADLKAVE